MHMRTTETEYERLESSKKEGFRRVLGSLEALCAALCGLQAASIEMTQFWVLKAPKMTPQRHPKRVPEMECLQLPNLKLSWSDLGPI